MTTEQLKLFPEKPRTATPRKEADLDRRNRATPERTPHGNWKARISEIIERAEGGTR